MQSLCHIAVIGDDNCIKNYCFKIVTNCLIFTLTMRVFWYSQKYACFTQRSSSNRNNMIASFMHISCDANFTIFTSRIFTNSTIRSWIDNGESAVDCTNSSISAHLSMKCFPRTKQDCLYYHQGIFSEDIRSHIDANIQILISNGRRQISFLRCEIRLWSITRLRRWIMRRYCKNAKVRW